MEYFWTAILGLLAAMYLTWVLSLQNRRSPATIWSMEEHNEAVRRIAELVKGFHERHEQFRIYHGSTNSTRLTGFEKRRTVDVSHLRHVIYVDTQRKVAVVEANVPMDVLIDATLEHGLAPPVVPEFPGITVGGAFSGTAGESSSFRHGFFDKTINWCEIVLANGEIVRASAETEPDLFFGAASTFGTLGVITLLEVRLTSASKYVELTYVPVISVHQAITTVQEVIKTSAEVQYIDGILFSKAEGVVICGRLSDGTDSQSAKVQRFFRRQDPWFYLHASKLSRCGTTTTELVPLKAYLFRYDRGAFWTGRLTFKLFHAPFDWLSRFIFDSLLRTRKLYQALNASGYTQNLILQDLAIPFDNVETFIEYVDCELGIYPLWLCPLRLDSMNHVPLRARIGLPDTKTHPNGSITPSTSATPLDGPMYLLNVGVWGLSKRDHNATISLLNRALEAKVKELGGFKWLYANAYYTEEEFWEIYDRPWYDALRKKYAADSLPNVYDKVKAREGKKPLSRLKGLWTAVVGSEHLLTT